MRSVGRRLESPAIEGAKGENNCIQSILFAFTNKKYGDVFPIAITSEFSTHDYGGKTSIHWMH